jgi:hypothetical protein
MTALRGFLPYVPSIGTSKERQFADLRDGHYKVVFRSSSEHSRFPECLRQAASLLPSNSALQGERSEDQADIGKLVQELISPMQRPICLRVRPGVAARPWCSQSRSER